MEDIQQVRKAFREARIVGEQLLSQDKITWGEHCFVMVGFEEHLRNLGEVL